MGIKLVNLISVPLGTRRTFCQYKYKLTTFFLKNFTAKEVEINRPYSD